MSVNGDVFHKVLVIDMWACLHDVLIISFLLCIFNSERFGLQ